MSNFFDNFMGGLAFGMMVNNPLFRGCYGFGYGGFYNTVNFGGFANPFPSIFGSGMYSSQMTAQPMPTTFANSSFPTVDFTEVGQYIWDSTVNPDSEYNKRMKEFYRQYEEYGKAKKTESKEKTDKKDENVSAKSGINKYDDKRFNKFLSIILDREGGYSNDENDKGGETFKGVTHKTYDQYRTSKGLSKQSVTKMTDDEMQEIYYEMFYKASGADKISDKKLALYVFDTAVNMGVKKAKEFYEACDGSRSKFEKLRKNRYKEIIANDKTQKDYEDGWENRMSAIRKAADNELNAIA